MRTALPERQTGEAGESMTIDLRLVRREPEGDHVVSLLFEPQSPLLFKAGQFLRFTVPHMDADERGISRSFTIASAPSEPLVRLTTRVEALPSTFKQALSSLTPGSLVQAGGPFGSFVYDEAEPSAVLIAGGIGITPFRAMLADLATRPRRRRPAISLLYSNASADIPFRAYFDHLRADWPELQIAYTVTRPTPEWRGESGRIDGEFIQRHVLQASRQLYLVCGPSALVDAMRATLSEIGVDPARVMHEGFPGYTRQYASVMGVAAL